MTIVTCRYEGNPCCRAEHGPSGTPLLTDARELTVRFVLKVMTFGLIAGTVFWYYLSDLRRDEKEVKA